MATEAAKRAAEAAVKCIGLGYDLTEDLRLKYCKWNSSRLISIDDSRVRDITIPCSGVVGGGNGGGVSIPNVSKSIKCDKGERSRLRSDILSFQQMSEQFNQELSTSGKIPSGHFNAAFEFTGIWQKDAANTKTLAFDGVFITLYNIALEKSQAVLCDHIKQAVPSSWDPAALAKFIEKYGTHVIVGVRMGGKDVIYVKQQYPSLVEPVDVQKKLKEMADKILLDGTGRYSRNSDKLRERAKFAKEQGLALVDPFSSGSYSHMESQDMKFMCKRKGGSEKSSSHDDWCHTVQSEPDVVSMSFIPIISLLSGIHGSGYLTHAINLYLRYKPPIEELHQFLEFQLPKHWAPVFGELAVGPDKRQSSASLQLSFMGPKLYVNTIPVEVGKKPVTGVRLYLEGKRNNCLAIHLQHLSSLPNSFQLEDEPNGSISHPSNDRRYYEKVQWKSFSHICTAPVESDEDLSIVTGAHFEVGDSSLKKVLFLRLQFSKVISAATVRRTEWDGSPGLAQKSGIISTLISTRFSTAQKQTPPPLDVNINSALYPEGPPVPAQATKLLRFVDTTEMTRGPLDSPGYWVVSGAKLHVEKGKISLRVKYSLLSTVLPDDVSMEF
ncbi:MACPF domain-containing protein [Tripterygium wilfordii]|uniref:MACPF domain-containing protein n=1 Tax=Tripterygium wilfordii TaxID=458696 RepID=A0A7J7DFG3_TRIWF|nr:MACPF domain-containing protein At4g24290-like [Tripterygium wilfordii]XP_038705961.1 MACPF domain-containing protein At4g24290-like [Tripterygium wilfordii]XP_038705962.1 MACPF domain-containing protein At4g24290-like [Tripterygium wilfordii]KAF5745097.1 MACPF domain-containing protein [Tripterygium wilfordii]